MKYVLIALWFSVSCIAQEMVIQPEETPYLLAPGQIQIETAMGYREENKQDKRIIVPNSLWKIGLIKKMEFRVQLEHQWTIGAEITPYFYLYFWDLKPNYGKNKKLCLKLR